MRALLVKNEKKGNRDDLPKGIFQNKASSGKANGRIMLFGGNILPPFQHICFGTSTFIPL